MAHHEIKFEGIADLEKALVDKIGLDALKHIVRHNGTELQQKAQKNADFKKGYQTGTTKRSISLDMKDEGLTAQVEPGTEYAAYLEFGTRFMEAQPYLKPAYEEQMKKFKQDLERLVK